MPERVGVYIDGFNLYYGVRAATGHRFLWLDVEKLSRELLRPHQTLVSVTYFTSRVRTPAASHLRQTAYLEALQAGTGIEIVEGFLQQSVRTCRSCGVSWNEAEEKKTDVHIACRMLDDAHRNRVDVSTLISADSDLAPVIGLIRALPRRRVLVAFPPRRYSTELVRVTNGAIKFVSVAMLRRSQLPDRVITPTGLWIRRPAHWQ